MGASRSLSRLPAWLALFGVFLTGGASPAWAGDSYLDALKAEASSDIPVPDTRSADAEVAQEDDGRPPPRTDDQPQMEAWLKQNYMGSYMFYQRLSPTKKRAVYRLYRSGAEITEIRKEINELLRQ